MEEPNVSAGWFLLARAPGHCYKCGAENVFAIIIVPPGHLVEGEEEDPNSKSDDYSLLTWISAINETARTAVSELAPLWKQAHSFTLDEDVFMNHCTACGAHQGDYFLCKPGAPFWPYDQEEANRLSLSKIETPIQVSCGTYSYGLTFEIGDDLRARIPSMPEPRPKPTKGKARPRG